MNDSKSIDDMIARFTIIINDLASLADFIDNGQNVRKVIRTLPSTQEVKSTTLKELNDKEKMEFIGLIGNFKTHEMERKSKEEKSS